MLMYIGTLWCKSIIHKKKMAMEMDRVVKKVFAVLVFIGRGIKFKSLDVMFQSYRTLFRPHMEYCFVCHIKRMIGSNRQCRRDSPGNWRAVVIKTDWIGQVYSQWNVGSWE